MHDVGGTGSQDAVRWAMIRQEFDFGFPFLRILDSIEEEGRWAALWYQENTLNAGLLVRRLEEADQ